MFAYGYYAFCNCLFNLLLFCFQGTDSPQAVRKLMSLSEPGRTRQRRAKHSVSSLHSINSPPGSPPPTNAKKVKGHERSQSDCSVTQPVSLSAESSSVTSLPARKHHMHHHGMYQQMVLAAFIYASKVFK